MLPTRPLSGSTAWGASGLAKAGASVASCCGLPANLPTGKAHRIRQSIAVPSWSPALTTRPAQANAALADEADPTNTTSAEAKAESTIPPMNTGKSVSTSTTLRGPRTPATSSRSTVGVGLWARIAGVCRIPTSRALSWSASRAVVALREVGLAGGAGADEAGEQSLQAPKYGVEGHSGARVLGRGAAGSGRRGLR
jgi:hypothetical protein